MTSFYLTFDYFHVHLKFVVHKVRTLVMLLLKFHGFTVKGTQNTHSGIIEGKSMHKIQMNI